MKGGVGMDRIERICETTKVITSPVVTENGTIYFSCHDGKIYRFRDGTMGPIFQFGGQANGLVIDSNNISYVTDVAHQSIMSKRIDDKTDEVSYLIKDFEGEPLLGPHSLVIRKSCSFFIRGINFYRFRTFWRYFL